MPYPDDPQDAPHTSKPDEAASGRLNSAPPEPPKADSKKEDEDPEEEGMVRMSFLDHLEELRTRLIRIVMGMMVAFFVAMLFMNQLWSAVRAPMMTAMKSLGYPPELAALTPMEGIQIVWFKVPLLAALFIAAPWVLYQVWAFIAPGLYKRERRMAVPFILSTAGLFILGGCFAYFVGLRFGLAFLLSISKDAGIHPYISASEYFDLFVNVILGVALIFELPILVFFLTLLHLVHPSFLIKHSRYAILGITILAAAVTPTPDAVNMTIFAAPMIVLYFVGVFASYLLVLHREKRSFPWRKVIKPLLFWTLMTIIGVVAIAVFAYHYKLVMHWPFLMK
jgi:sec-independent protein translocase protein TatC